jgi:hypothetical protein
MNLLVTSGAGYIGSACAQALLEAGHTSGRQYGEWGDFKRVRPKER